jgi:hypothetical protein
MFILIALASACFTRMIGMPSCFEIVLAVQPFFQAAVATL